MGVNISVSSHPRASAATGTDWHWFPAGRTRQKAWMLKLTRGHDLPRVDRELGPWGPMTDSTSLRLLRSHDCEGSIALRSFHCTAPGEQWQRVGRSSCKNVDGNQNEIWISDSSQRISRLATYAVTCAMCATRATRGTRSRHSLAPHHDRISRAPHLPFK